MDNAKGKILCVDDDLDTREMLTLLLGTAGYQVVASGSIREGLHLAVEHDVDLIVLDWVLSDGTGVQLCTTLRSIGITAPVLFCTGMEITKERLDAVSGAGAQGFLAKPIEADNILLRVSELMSQPKSGHQAT